MTKRITEEECLQAHKELWEATKAELKADCKKNGFGPFTYQIAKERAWEDTNKCAFCDYCNSNKLSCTDCPARVECRNMVIALRRASSYLGALKCLNEIIAVNPWTEHEIRRREKLPEWYKWLLLHRPEDAARARRNIVRHGYDSAEEAMMAGKADELIRAFFWGKSPEGHRHWIQVEKDMMSSYAT